ncbi:hypothetical protein NHX12_029036 [Muraenolepis orangiensis]|uniref:Uncharacterized protein n=1 Tax=Muraenolepis orangiensis TaxID=630683 RepID=A0A9Q0EF99_9TELE|nr:hypothetical protein NHX12_029036 [Muraenolepis orangiensis]
MARRLFGEGGTFSKREADELQKVLERSSQRTDALKDSLRVDMEALESSSLEQVKEAVDRLEEKLSHLLVEMRIGSGPPSSLSLADGTTTSTVTMATNNKPITTVSANATSAVTVATSSSGQTWVTVEPCLDATTTAGSVRSRYTRTSSCTETEL